MPRVQVARLASLTFRTNGFMAYEIRYQRKREGAWAYWVEDVDTHQILSWALVFPTSYWNGRRDTPVLGVYFYTRAAFRKRGYTHRLMKQVRKNHKQMLQLYPHNEGSTEWASKIKHGDRRVRTW